MKIVNLTGHELVLGTPEKRMRFPSKGRVRLETRYREVELVRLGNTTLEIPVLELANGHTASLPEPEEGTLYVVSDLVAKRVARSDVVAPVRFSRDASGRVQYARALLRHKKK